MADGKVWASGVLWEPGTNKEAATQRIYAALESAGIPADSIDASQTYVSTQYGAANRQLAGGSFNITFTDPAAAVQLLEGNAHVSLPIKGANSSAEAEHGSPVWTKHPGTYKLFMRFEARKMQQR